MYTDIIRRLRSERNAPKNGETTAGLNRADQEDATIRCLLLTSVSPCFGHHYAHHQENKGPVTAFGVLFWFDRMWLVAVVGCCLTGCDHARQPLQTTSCRTTTTHQMQ
jgi:hypothetical protein